MKEQIKKKVKLNHRSVEWLRHKLNSLRKVPVILKEKRSDGKIVERTILTDQSNSKYARDIERRLRVLNK